MKFPCQAHTAGPISAGVFIQDSGQYGAGHQLLKKVISQVWEELFLGYVFLSSFTAIQELWQVEDVLITKHLTAYDTLWLPQWETVVAWSYSFLCKNRLLILLQRSVSTSLWWTANSFNGPIFPPLTVFFIIYLLATIIRHKVPKAPLKRLKKRPQYSRANFFELLFLRIYSIV